MALDKSWIDTALAITGDFETFGDPFAGVSGDFDGMGISCGVLQWNIGQGSLQPLVKGCGRAAVTAAMPRFGEALWKACHGTVTEGLKIVRSWQTNAVLNKTAKRELQALMGSQPMRAQQVKAADSVAKQAYEMAKTWCKAVDGSTEPDLRSFCWYFDVVTQNGGPKGLTYNDVSNFIQIHSPAKVDDVVCDWLAAAGASKSGWKDARRNAKLWRDVVPAAQLPLLVLSYLRALKSRTEYQAVVFNRKGSIAMGIGWVNGEKTDLSAQLP